MDESARNAFLAQPLTAVLSTIGRDGNIHSVPVWYLWGDGVFRVITHERSQKVRNIERTGRATLCIDDRTPKSPGFVTAEGPVEIRREVTQTQRLELWRQYHGEDAERRVAAAGDNTASACWLVLTPEHWIG